MVRLHEAVKAEAAVAPPTATPAQEAALPGASEAGGTTPEEAGSTQLEQAMAPATAAGPDGGDRAGTLGDAKADATAQAAPAEPAEPAAQSAELPSMDDLASKTKASRSEPPSAQFCLAYPGAVPPLTTTPGPPSPPPAQP